MTTLKQIRSSMKLSQESVLRHCEGITLATYRAAENGRNVSYTTAVAIARGLEAIYSERGAVTVVDPMSLGLKIV